MNPIALPLAKPPPPKVFDHISYSAISTFQTCPLRFYFRYVLGLPVRTISSSLVMGSALHRAVQHHFEQLLIGNHPDLASLLEAYHEGWQSFTSQNIQFSRGEDVSSLDRLAERLLRSFLVSEFSQPKGTIIGIEEELRGPVVPGCPDFLARLDLITDDGNEVTISDFKSSRCAWSHYKVDDVAPQLILYSELAKTFADGRPIKLSFAVLTKTKIPSLTMHKVPLDDRIVQRTKRTVERVWRAIQAGHFYPNPSPFTCGSCSYRDACRRWTG